MHEKSESLDAFAVCGAQLRQKDYNLWFSCLFVPEEQRNALYALYNFTTEISGMPQNVREPFLGEIRLQWWQEVLDNTRYEEGRQHPQARVLQDIIAHYNLPSDAMIAMVNAHIDTLYDDPVADMNELEGYLGETISARMRLATLILAQGKDPGGAVACGHAGVALGLLRLLSDFSNDGSRGRFLVPVSLMARFGVSRNMFAEREVNAALRLLWQHLGDCMLAHLQAAEAEICQMPHYFKPVFAELALVRPFHKRMIRANYDLFNAKTGFSRLRIQWIVWRYHLTAKK